MICLQTAVRIHLISLTYFIASSETWRMGGILSFYTLFFLSSLFSWSLSLSCAVLQQYPDRCQCIELELQCVRISLNSVPHVSTNVTFLYVLLTVNLYQPAGTHCNLLTIPLRLSLQLILIYSKNCSC